MLTTQLIHIFFDFVVFSVKEVQNRVANAEHNSNFTSHEEFWSDIDRKVQNFQSLS